MNPRGKKGKDVTFIASERAQARVPAALTLDVSADGRRTVWKERRVEDVASLPEPPPFEEQEDLHAAALADSVDGFSYLLGENVDTELESNATPADHGIVIRVKSRNINSVSVSCLLNPRLLTTYCRIIQC